MQLAAPWGGSHLLLSDTEIGTLRCESRRNGAANGGAT
jgi:hypothetical protein